ncbi:hypothetical protein WOLCODRAFT_22657 [Wolfiporia cocos MD-104 SS10]|uniref:Pyridoxamine 5'-phosphate oxidase Alr4036 family FMN-binding domain-containing protein n=1 Tax=Wolfiporia cocos (strain MD-104) TaxID=742152 RepID=A0A2H3J3M1_WOLCO|nr:hypothetical protein WOLCODRAFT_22657 [Wolfiporia cocos MD-104 SS10]
MIATVDNDGVPRVRSVGHRELLHPAGSPNLPIIVTSTDIRTPKIEQMRRSRTGLVELCCWMAGSKDQFRILGATHFVTAPDAGIGAQPIDVNRPSLALDKLTGQGFDWEAKRQELFDSIDEHGKAWWCKPPPGSVMDPHANPKDWPRTIPKLGEAQSEEDRCNQERALHNFALVLIEVVEVDWARVSTDPHQRTRFVRIGEEWEEQTLMP